jgi:hypothetical protein
MQVFWSKYDTAFQRLRDNNRILGGYDFVLRNAGYTLQTRTEQTFFLLWEATRQIGRNSPVLPITYLLQRTLEVRTQ